MNRAVDGPGAPLTAALAPPVEPLRAHQLRFQRSALWVLAFTLAVILFGAIVRITGSGAGCGQHWPTCHGEIAHLPQSLETAIELGHRLTSGLSALAVFALTWRAFRLFGPRHAAARASAIASAFMLIEALIGAVLVRHELVAGNTSSARALVMPLHLVSTSVLIGALASAFWWSHARAEKNQLGQTAHSTRRAAYRVGAGLAGALLVSASGAVTALGDTLFPAQPSSFAERLQLTDGAHLLERLRVLHPILAVLLAVYLFAVLPGVLSRGYPRAARAFSRAALALVSLQVVAGSVNVLLSAPGWMQIAHLLLACLVWLALVLLWLELWAPRSVP